MAIKKNVASQKLAVYAYDPTTAAGTDPSKTGDAANISAQISLDGGASAATNDVAPTELDAADHPGVYIFDLTQAETNAEMILLSAVSSTSNILLDPIQVLTIPEKVTLADAAHGGVAATLTLKGVTVTATDSNAIAVALTGNGTGSGLYCYSSDGHGIRASSNSGSGLYLTSTSASGIYSSGEDAVWAKSTNGSALRLTTLAGTDLTSATISAIKAKTDDLTFTVANQVDSNDLSGGGDATAANQAALISLLQNNPASSVPNQSNKSVYNGDTFNGTADMPFMTFAVTLDATGADSVALVIFDKDTPATIHKQVACTATSATLITAAAFDIDFGGSLTFAGCPLSATCGFAVVATTSGKDSTLAFGDFYVINRADPT